MAKITLCPHFLRVFTVVHKIRCKTCEQEFSDCWFCWSRFNDSALYLMA